MKPPMLQGAPDDFQTPPIALKPLLPYIPKDWVVWECACGHGYMVDALEKEGYKVIATDLYAEPARDFLAWHPTPMPNVVITNPPYSIKQKFLERSYGLNVPFALLLPLTTFETRKRQDLFRKFGVEVIFFDKRINFMTPSGQGSGSWFATAWFTWGLNIGKEMTFARLEE